jgi:putative SOS response-associated peptidase YedK
VGNKLINSRVESLQIKPIFRQLFQTKRCLVPADGFFEWKKTASSKIPFRITLKSGQLFAFAGLWDVWHGEKEEEIKSFTILTTESNSLVRDLHHRMPLILRKENEALWLDPETPQERLVEALKPIPAQEMTIFEVSNIVNSWKTDSPACIQPK